MDTFYIKNLECFSAIFSMVTFYFGARQKMVTWPISIAISMTNLPIYYFAGLYASFLQNIIYVFVSLYGWYSWRFGGKDRSELKMISTTSLREALCMGVGVILYVVVMNPILIKLGSTITLWDSIRSALTMAGMWVTSHKKIETYLVWFVVNAISIVIFYQKSMYWFMLKYTVFLCLSVYSYFVWLAQYRKQKEDLV